MCREELPLTEDEERERALIISKVKEVQLRARELLDVWKLLQGIKETLQNLFS